MRAERNAGRPPQPLIIVFTSKRAADEGIACRFIFFFIESHFLLSFHQLTTLVENLTAFLFKFMPQVPPGGLVFYLKNFKIFGFKKKWFNAHARSFTWCLPDCVILRLPVLPPVIAFCGVKWCKRAPVARLYRQSSFRVCSNGSIRTRKCCSSWKVSHFAQTCA